MQDAMKVKKLDRKGMGYLLSSKSAMGMNIKGSLAVVEKGMEWSEDEMEYRIDSLLMYLDLYYERDKKPNKYEYKNILKEKLKGNYPTCNFSVVNL